MEESSKMLIANRAVQFGEDVTVRNHNPLLKWAATGAAVGVLSNLNMLTLGEVARKLRKARSADSDT